MFDLLKKIVNYFTPIDEEAEVERAAAASPIVKSDDASLAAQTISDKDVNNKPAASNIPKVSADSAGPEPSKSFKASEASDATKVPEISPQRPIYAKPTHPYPNPPITFSTPYTNVTEVDATKRKRAHRTQNPGEGKFKVDIEPVARKTPDHPPTTTNGKKIEKGYWTYDMNDNPLFLPDQTTTTTTTSKPNNHTPGLNGAPTNLPGSQDQTAATAPKTEIKDEATAPKSRKGRPVGSKNKKKSTKPGPSTTKESTKEPTKESTKESQLGKRPKSMTKKTTTASEPVATKRQRLMHSEPHTTRGRSKKLGDHQCLVCGETFFDLESRDEHAEMKHPTSKVWRH